ncbi:hypothetical protein T02_3139 [Trichinella nativa]|uniref:Uncharacterized protein n=1 Tax=Trichinella nativa TaxID=6335 RepID=A0A0V1LKI3_9BILA|nr:hypothetical protein T02_3139 [Trichinella nativa]
MQFSGVTLVIACIALISCLYSVDALSLTRGTILKRDDVELPLPNEMDPNWKLTPVYVQRPGIYRPYVITGRFSPKDIPEDSAIRYP